MDLNSREDTQSKNTIKPPVVRGARACTVCRAAKMKCVGAEDGQKQCQRCRRANVECIFEKHRRGRKPGSKLSEASKMLRRLEKGLNNAKLKSQSVDSTSASFPAPDPRDDRRLPGASLSSDQYGSPSNRYPSNELTPLKLPYHPTDTFASNHHHHPMDTEDDGDSPDRSEAGIFPEGMIKKENQRQSFFGTVLGPEHRDSPSPAPPSAHDKAYSISPTRSVSSSNGISDPISAGIIEEDQVKLLFDLIFLRLNPFVNMFDPVLHTVEYVRAKCPFLFTTLIMAGCKFFKPELYAQCRKLANELAVRAFIEDWQRVEVVQAFACMVHWKEPDENRTWTYIGFACRMAVQLGLNRYVPHSPAHETEFQMRERRNRERTYLVLFVHDRSLSMQTGRQWMLPEDELVRHSMNWHELGGSHICPEDVIVVAFVQLRRMASETTDVFYTNKASLSAKHNDVNYEVVLRNCNTKLHQWMDTWQEEMRRAGGDSFHFSLLNFFLLHVRLFLNSFGIQASMASSRASPSLQALSACCTSALDTLQIVVKDFASVSMLRYGQDSITVMTAYSAVFLVTLLRSSNTMTQLNESTVHEIYTLISKTADAYHDASILSPASPAAAYHARFLRSLVAHDIFKIRKMEKERLELHPVDPRFKASGRHPPTSQQFSGPSQSQTSPQTYTRHHGLPAYFPPTSPHVQTHHSTALSDSVEIPGAHNAHQPHHSTRGYSTMPHAPVPHALLPVPQHASELDAHYWRNMLLELGLGADQAENSTMAGTPTSAAVSPFEDVRVAPYMNQTQTQAAASHPFHTPPSHTASSPQPHAIHQMPYHHMHNSARASYGR